LKWLLVCFQNHVVSSRLKTVVSAQASSQKAINRSQVTKRHSYKKLLIFYTLKVGRQTNKKVGSFCVLKQSRSIGRYKQKREAAVENTSSQSSFQRHIIQAYHNIRSFDSDGWSGHTQTTCITLYLRVLLTMPTTQLTYIR